MGAAIPVPPETFGRYALGPKLGAGGMATVTFGLATGALGFARPVAIKRIHPTFASEPALREAIRDEARIAARIRHPNVVSVIDVIDDGEGVAIVLEYVHGESLSALLKESRARQMPVPVAVAVAVLIDVLHGLHAAHSAVDEKGAALSVIHRDVSPQNVLVGADGVARVLDFGISKAESRSTVTRDGQVKGKLRYMAPEQLGGSNSVASDTYAAGLLLWEALAGRSPFGDVGHDGELVRRVLSGVSSPPSSLRPEVSAALDAVAAKALAVEAEGRFASAGDMAAALEASGLAASRTVVAGWVQALAREVLRERAGIVLALEQGAEGTAKHLADLPPAGLPVVPNQEQTSNAPLVVAAAIEPRRSLRRWFQAVVLALTLLGAVLVAAVVILRRPAVESGMSGPTSSVVASSAVAGAKGVAAATTSSMPPEAEPSAAPREPVDGGARATVPSAVVSSRAPGRLKSSRPGSLDCTVPYTIDANGYHHYRRECFE